MKSLVMYNKSLGCIECERKERIPILCSKHFCSGSNKCQKHYRKLLSMNEDVELLCPYGFYTIKKGDNIYTSLVFKEDNDNIIKNKLKYINEKLNSSYLYDREDVYEIISDINKLIEDNNVMMDCTHELGNIGTYFNTMSARVERNHPEMCEEDEVKAMLSLYEMMNYRLSLMNDLSEIGYKRKTIKLHPLLDKLKIIMSYKAENRRVRIRLANCDLYVEGFDYLYLAFFILLDNSIKYSPENRDVNIYFKNVNNSKVTVIVENSGPKIESSEKEKIKARGYRGIHSSNVMGNGIGLSIFNEICNKANINYNILTDNRVSDDEYLFSVCVELNVEQFDEKDFVY